MYGRRKVCILGMMALVLVGLSGVFSPNIEYFLVMRLITGITYGIYQTASVLIFVEAVGPEYRVLMSLAYMGSWGMGIMILPGMAMLLKDWWKLQLVTYIPLCLISPALMWKFVPESPRWLLTVGRDEEAEKVICEAAKINGIEIPDAENVMRDLKRKIHDEENTEPVSKPPTFGDLLRSSKTIKRVTIILYVAFFMTRFIYYGIFNLALKGNTGSVYMNLFFIGLGEVIGSGVCILEAKLMNRKKCLFRNCFFSGIIFLIALGIPYSFPWLRMLIAILSATINAIASTLLWLFIAEILPTNLRTVGVSGGMAMGRISSLLIGILLDFQMMLDLEWTGMMGLFAGVAFFTSALCLLLPNIKETHLPDSIEETKRLPETVKRRRVGLDRNELRSFFHKVFVSRN